MIKHVLTLFLICFSAINSSAATIYMGSGETHTTLQSAMSAMQGGDTLIIRDGTYTGDANIINSDINQDPPNGSVGNYTKVIAEHDGSVFFDGEYARTPVSLFACSYIKFEGILWGRSSSNVLEIGSPSYPPGHIKFLRCGFRDAQQFSPASATSGSCVVVGTTDRVLFEECYCFGHYRYGFYAGVNGLGIIFRRCVARTDSCNTTTGNSAFNVYDAQNVELQNCITIDINNPANYYLANNTATAPRNYMVRDTESGYDTTGIYFRGCIALNNANGHSLFETGGGVTEVSFINSVFWNTYYGAWCRNGGVSFDHCTIGDVYGTSESPSLLHGIYIEAGSNPVTNTILYGIDNASAVLGNGSYSAGDYNYFYNNTVGNYSVWEAGDHDRADLDPMAGSLEYLVRIEADSDYSGVASDSGDVGATIIYQYGKSGTFWGETGYDKLQDGTDGQVTAALWPFPNEDIIRDKMAIADARGFCSNTANPRTDTGYITLTSYIWEYLGNTGMTASLYETSPTYDQPTISVDDTNTGTSSSGTITGTCTIDDALSFGLCTWSHSSGSVTGFATVLLGVVSGTVTGLPVGETTVSFSLLDSEDQEATDTALFTRSALSNTSKGVTIQGVQWNQ